MCYLRRTREVGSRGKYWTFSFHHSNGEVFLEARFPEIPKEVVVCLPGQPEAPLLRLKAWRWFWWNGRYDVVDCSTASVLGTLRRTGGIEGPDRRAIGRVRNDMPVRKSVFHLITIGLLDSLLSGGNDSSTLPVDEFRVDANGMQIGSLRRVTLPFLQPADAPQSNVASKRGGRLNRIRSWLRRRVNSGGWRLDWQTAGHGAIDPRVRLAAALFCIQIEERYR
jgi:hypothetical protein